MEPVIVLEIKKRSTWLRPILEEVEGHATPDGTSGGVKKRKIFTSYAALMKNLIDAEPSTYEEVTSQQVWKEVMNEAYQSIMKNDVWEIMPRPEGKSVVTSKWIYMIRNVADGSIDK